ncbi:hypothetical protein [Corallococcus sp. 4LFB]|uniref:hypothetical protein n=1 Tax=Corallococcus sp. 4LFB TaxID=3383249 RepID=UPI003974C8AC
MLAWTARPTLSSSRWGLLALAWTLAAAVAGTVISTRKIRRENELGDQAFAIVLRVLSALNLLGLLLWGALAAVVLSRR